MIALKTSRYLIPEWPAPANVRAVVTTKQCGNLAAHDQEDPSIAAANRQRLLQDLALPPTTAWLRQVHGVDAINLDCERPTLIGDACYTQTPQRACVILTADCLPLFLTNRQGDKIAAIHAGWRGLLAGVIDATIQGLQISPADLLVWLGPAIGPDHFEVGVEVRDTFIARHPDYAAGFHQADNGRWFADLYQLARINCRHCQVQHIYGGGLCTFCDNERFYSYRRDKNSPGRIASLIWLTAN